MKELELNPINLYTVFSYDCIDMSCFDKKESCCEKFKKRDKPYCKKCPNY